MSKLQPLLRTLSAWRDWLSSRIKFGYKIDTTELERFGRIFRFSDSVFKFASWIAVSGLFKFVADKYGSNFAYGIHMFLTSILFVVGLSLLEAVELKIFDSNSRWKRNSNTTIMIVIYLAVAWYFYFHGILRVVDEIAASK